VSAYDAGCDMPDGRVMVQPGDFVFTEKTMMGRMSIAARAVADSMNRLGAELRDPVRQEAWMRLRAVMDVVRSRNDVRISQMHVAYRRRRR